MYYTSLHGGYNLNITRRFPMLNCVDLFITSGKAELGTDPWKSVSCHIWPYAEYNSDSKIAFW